MKTVIVASAFTSGITQLDSGLLLKGTVHADTGRGFAAVCGLAEFLGKSPFWFRVNALVQP